MNVGNILLVADAIERASVPGLGFNMGGFVGRVTDTFPDLSGRSCGTAACIAGWTVAVHRNGAIPEQNQPDIDYETDAGVFLGLRDTDTEALFFPAGFTNDIHTPEMAIRCLRNLAITGKVDWELAMKGDEPVLPPLPASKSLARVRNPA
jgi:hypothetical protein